MSDLESERATELRAIADLCAAKQAVLSRENDDCPGVYLIFASSTFKIGRASRSMLQRFRAICTASPEPLELAKPLSYNPDDERGFHAQFRQFHSHGEWFRMTDESLKMLEKIVDAREASEREELGK